MLPSDSTSLPSDGGVAADAPKPQPGTPEYDAAMLRRAEAAGVGLDIDDQGSPKDPEAAPANEPESKPQRPDWIPEKFWDPELGVEGSSKKMAQAYAELERNRNKPKPPAPKPDAAKPAAAKPEGEGSDPAAEKLQSVGLDLNTFETEYAETGELSDASYEALEKAGIDRHTVDAYIEGQQALVNQKVNHGKSLAGGEESYKAMTEWARANLSEAELEQYNSMVGGSVDQITLAVKGLHARYTAAVGNEPKLQSGGNRPAPGVGTYASLEELSKDQRDPRYKTDPQYRKMVEAKAAKSTF